MLLWVSRFAMITSHRRTISPNVVPQLSKLWASRFSDALLVLQNLFPLWKRSSLHVLGLSVTH
jgi:hypothetical protein